MPCKTTLSFVPNYGIATGVIPSPPLEVRALVIPEKIYGWDTPIDS